MRKIVILLALGSMIALPAAGTTFYVAPDVATDSPSGGVTIFRPWEIARDDSGSWSSTLLLPAGIAVDAAHRTNGGDWLLSLATPAELPPGGGGLFEAGDILRYDGVNFLPVLDAGSAGLPAGANVDAVFRIGGDSGDLVVSFDAPASIGGSNYDPADLVRFDGVGFAIYFDASAAQDPIPLSSNVTGADRLADGRILMTFDVPTTLGGSTFLPGELVTWSSATGFNSYRLDGNWPLSSRVNACGLLAAPGLTPPTVRVDRSTLIPGDIRLTWDPSCSTGGEYYGIYEGSIGAWPSHRSVACARSGFSEEVTPGAGDRYYLVVPHNSNVEGSYGQDSLGNERPRGSPTVCNGTQELEPCP